jgi:transposase
MENALVGWKWEAVVRALMSLRGVQLITGMTLVAEAGDMSRFDEPGQLMSYFGLTASEHTSGNKRSQGGITKCGNNACRRLLTESAWHYRLTPKVSEAIQKRGEKQSKAVQAIAWKAQKRLHHRYKTMTAHRKKSVVVNTAIARELVGFVWAIVCQMRAPEKLKPSTVVAAPIKPVAASGKRDYQLKPAAAKTAKPAGGRK